MLMVKCHAGPWHMATGAWLQHILSRSLLPLVTHSSELRVRAVAENLTRHILLNQRCISLVYLALLYTQLDSNVAN